MVMFGWGASVFYHLRRPPAEAMHIYAVGKQWMWKFQHLEGQREINELHVPAGRPVKMTITLRRRAAQPLFPGVPHQDRRDSRALHGALVRGRPSPGAYHIFCAEYCGTNHSGMIGNVIVMEPAQYQAWLAGGGMEGTLAQRGAKLFNDLACVTLPPRHRAGPRAVAQGHRRHDRSSCRTARRWSSTKRYLRESILNSQAKIVKGFQPLMPTFQGLISEEDLVALIEHVKSLSPKATTARRRPRRRGPASATQPRRRRRLRRSKPCWTRSRSRSTTT